jgi:carbohydrate-selective porin OprB
MEPKLTGSDRTVGTLLGRREDPDTGLHVEGLYKFKLTDNILITPGVIWLTAPGHDNDNDDIFVGTIRTTFTF